MITYEQTIEIIEINLIIEFPFITLFIRQLLKFHYNHIFTLLFCRIGVGSREKVCLGYVCTKWHRQDRRAL